MKTKYAAYNSGSPRIYKIEIERETKNFYFKVNGQRIPKRGAKHYFDSFEEAHAHLLQKSQEAHASALRNLAYQAEHLAEVHALVEAN